MDESARGFESPIHALDKGRRRVAGVVEAGRSHARALEKRCPVQRVVHRRDAAPGEARAHDPAVVLEGSRVDARLALLLAMLAKALCRRDGDAATIPFRGSREPGQRLPRQHRHSSVVGHTDERRGA